MTLFLIFHWELDPELNAELQTGASGSFRVLGFQATQGLLIGKWRCLYSLSPPTRVRCPLQTSPRDVKGPAASVKMIKLVVQAYPRLDDARKLEVPGQDNYTKRLCGRYSWMMAFTEGPTAVCLQPRILGPTRSCNYIQSTQKIKPMTVDLRSLYKDHPITMAMFIDWHLHEHVSMFSSFNTDKLTKFGVLLSLSFSPRAQHHNIHSVTSRATFIGCLLCVRHYSIHVACTTSECIYQHATVPIL